MKAFVVRANNGAEYHYAYRGGPRIKDARTGAPLKPGSVAYERRLRELLHDEVDDTPNGAKTVRGLIASFKADPHFFGNLSPSSRRAYDRFLAEIDDEFGGMKLRALSDPEARGEFLDWRNSKSDTPRTADYAWTTLKRLFNFGIERGVLSINPCQKGGRLHETDRSEIIWRDDDLNLLKRQCSRYVFEVVEIALWTGQRVGDVLRMRWSDFDGEFIRVVQSKSRRRGRRAVVVMVPVGETLRRVLGRIARRSSFILSPSKKRHGATHIDGWTRSGFRASFNKARAAAGLGHLHFHDLRGTAVVRLAEAGATEPEIASITGHSLDGVRSILSAYLPRTRPLAVAAITKLEGARKALAQKSAKNRKNAA